MQLPDLIFYWRVSVGRPFNRKRSGDAKSLDENLVRATTTVPGIEKVFPNYDAVLLQRDFQYLGRYLAVSGKGSNFAHSHVLAAAVQHVAGEISNPSILEIGTAKGFGTLCLSAACEKFKVRNAKITTVDFLPGNVPYHWGTVADIEFGKISRLALLNKIAPGLTERISFINRKSRDFTENSANKYDLVFIDGGHDEKSVFTELEFSAQHNASMIVVDDYDGIFKGVTRAVNKFMSTSSKFEIQTLSSSSIRKYAVIRRIDM